MKRKQKLILRQIIRLILSALHRFPEKFLVSQSAIKLSQGNLILPEKDLIQGGQNHPVSEYEPVSNAAAESVILHVLSQNKHFDTESFPMDHSSFAEHEWTRFPRYFKKDWNIFQPHEKPENKQKLLRALRVKPDWRLWLKKRYFRNHSG